MVMKHLNPQDYQVKTHNDRKGLIYLKKQDRTTTNQNQTLHSEKKKMQRKTLKQKIIGDHPAKKKKGRMENHRINWKRFKMAINNPLSITP